MIDVDLICADRLTEDERSLVLELAEAIRGTGRSPEEELAELERLGDDRSATLADGRVAIEAAIRDAHTQLVEACRTSMSETIARARAARPERTDAVVGRLSAAWRFDQLREAERELDRITHDLEEQ